MIEISIHALLAESDGRFGCLAVDPPHFYPRSPCGERLWANFSGFYWWVISIHALLAESDYDGLIASANFCRFLSTLSLRRATRVLEVTRNAHTDFYPRSPCGERPSANVKSSP